MRPFALFMSSLLCLMITACSSQEEPKAYDNIWEISYTVRTRYMHTPNIELEQWENSHSKCFVEAKFHNVDKDGVFSFELQEKEGMVVLSAANGDEIDTALFFNYDFGIGKWTERLYDVSADEVSKIVNSFNSLSSSCYSAANSTQYGILCEAEPKIIKGDQELPEMDYRGPWEINYHMEFYYMHNSSDVYKIWFNTHRTLFMRADLYKIVNKTSKRTSFDWGAIIHNELYFHTELEYDFGHYYWTDLIYNATEDEIKNIVTRFEAFSIGEYETQTGPYVRYLASYSKHQ